MSSFLASIASGLIVALVLVVARMVGRLSKMITESAAAVHALTAVVDTLLQNDTANREHITALWTRVYPRSYPPPQPSPPRWSTDETVPQRVHRARAR